MINELASRELVAFWTTHITYLVESRDGHSFCSCDMGNNSVVDCMMGF